VLPADLHDLVHGRELVVRQDEAGEDVEVQVGQELAAGQGDEAPVAQRQDREPAVPPLPELAHAEAGVEGPFVDASVPSR
jgi:hypothetical protein